jgi:hypothetical protein
MTDACPKILHDNDSLSRIRERLPKSLFDNERAFATAKGTMLKRCAYHEAGHVTACLCLGIPLSHVSIDPAHCLRDRYQPAHDVGLECLCTMGLAGAAAEICYCGPISDGGDQLDLQMVRDYLAPWFGPLQIATEFGRLRAAAARLVRTDWARQRIELIAAALLQRQTLSGAQIEALHDNDSLSQISERLPKPRTP